MEATITFANGSTITAEVNGNSLIVNSRPTFPEDLSVVTVTERDGAMTQTHVYHNAGILDCASVDGRYWFTILEESEQERTIRELREENELLEGAIAELAELIGG